MKKMLIALVLGMLTTGVWMCSPRDDFQAIHDLKDNQWPADSARQFTFTITDTTRQYDVFYLIRNAADYPFYNLYVKRSLIGPDGKLLSKQLEELILFNEKSGKPYGEGLGDIFDHKFRCVSLSKYRFPQSGNYTLKIEQYMRQDPLKGILSVGVIVEPTRPKKE